MVGHEIGLAVAQAVRIASIRWRTPSSSVAPDRTMIDTSIPRHLRAWGAMGIHDRLAGEVAIGMNVADLAHGDHTLDRMITAGRRLRDEHGAQVVVMGCAGMASFREPLQQALGTPVVEPSQAAASMALGRVMLGW